MLAYLKKLKEDNGFTLVEMAIVILIIAGLLLLMITNIGGVTDNVDKTTDEAIIQTVETQMVLFEIEFDREPNGLEELASEDYITQNQLDAYNAAIANTDNE
jgi:competence protein ComGC